MSRIRADKLVNRLGTGGPKFPHGVAEGFSVTGIVTATSFSGPVTGNVTGNATGLSGIPNLNVGIVTATSFEGNGAGLTGLNIPAASDWRDNSLF